MASYADQAAEAILANRPLPQAKLDDPNEIDAVATAITLRRLARAPTRLTKILSSGCDAFSPPS